MSDDALPSAVLLDTCAAIWLATGGRMESAAVQAIKHACRANGTFVSPVSAWEIGMLSRKYAAAGTLMFLPDPKTWFARLMAGPGIKAAAFTPDIAIDAAHLPGDLHRDPGDRLIVATARYLGLPIVTRDGPILAYAKSGHLRAIPC